MNNFLKKKGVGGVLICIALIATAIALIAYLVNGSAIRNVNAGVVILLIVALVGELVSLWKPFGGAPILIAAIAAGVAVGYYLSFSADYIGYLFTGVMGYAGTMGSFLTFVVTAVVSVVALIAANFGKLESK